MIRAGWWRRLAAVCVLAVAAGPGCGENRITGSGPTPAARAAETPAGAAR